LSLYTATIAKGGKKLVNKQLLPSRELMTKMLALWPKG
jgi:hypothetical protein